MSNTVIIASYVVSVDEVLPAKANGGADISKLLKWTEETHSMLLKNMVRPMRVHLWSRKPSNIICRTAVMCMVQCWMQRRPSIESTSVNYSER